ncbi:MAG: zinc-finger domain-containing protein, partial [Betaproteobacteria bacterium]
ELNSQGGVFCPNPSMALWSGHPRVYLNVAETGSVRCPYCGTVYRLKDGEHFHPHH